MMYTSLRRLHAEKNIFLHSEHGSFQRLYSKVNKAIYTGKFSTEEICVSKEGM